MQLPDAPWIREAETYGLPDDTVECPICGRECDEIWLDGAGDACGCEKCCRILDSWAWMQEEKERSRPG